MYFPQDFPLVLHLPTSGRPARSRSLPHMHVQRWDLARFRTCNRTNRRRTRYHCASDPAFASVEVTSIASLTFQTHCIRPSQSLDFITLENAQSFKRSIMKWICDRCMKFIMKTFITFQTHCIRPSQSLDFITLENAQSFNRSIMKWICDRCMKFIMKLV